MSDLEIIERLNISEEAADEIADQFGDDRGIIRDHTYDGAFYLVRWDDDVDSTHQTDGGPE